MDIDLFLLNKVNKLKAGSSGGSATASGYLLKSDGTTSAAQHRRPIYSIYGSNSRSGYEGQSWTSSTGHGGLYLNGGDARSRRMLFFSAAEYLDNSGVSAYYNKTLGPKGNFYVEGLQGGYGNYHGIKTNSMTSAANASYMPFGSRILFLRNPTASDISTSLEWNFSNKYNSGYDGSCIVQYTPTFSGSAKTFSTVNGVNATQLYGYTSNTWSTTYSQSFSVPANTTSALTFNNTMYDWTSTTNGYILYEINNLGQMVNLTNAGLESCLKCTAGYLSLGSEQLNQSDNDNNIIKWFNMVGEVYGEYS